MYFIIDPKVIEVTDRDMAMEAGEFWEENSDDDYSPGDESSDYEATKQIASHFVA